MSKKQKFTSIPTEKLEALLAENIRLRSAANRVWTRWWFLPALMAAVFGSAFAGTFLGQLL